MPIEYVPRLRIGLVFILVLLISTAALYAQEAPEPVESAAAVTPAEGEGAPPEPVDEAAPREVVPVEVTPVDDVPKVVPPAESPIAGVHAPGEEPAPPVAEPEDKALAELRRRAPRELLEIAGIDESQLRPLQDGWPLSDNELEITLKLLYRIRRFGQVDTALWSDPKPPLAQMAKNPADYRLQMFALRGRVVQVSVENPPLEIVERYDFEKYYACLVELDGSKQPVLVITPTIPRQWDLTQPIDEPISAQGLFVKAGEERGDFKQLVFLAARIAWHPDRIHADKKTQSVNLGMTELGRLGMDVGLLDAVHNRERITDRDREAFYQMLAAVNRAPQNQLTRFALASLPQMQKTWQAEIVAGAKELVEQRAALAAFKGSAEEREKLSKHIEGLSRRVAVLQKAEKEAREGRYSVYPLFNLSDEQHGQLVFLKGVARRAIKVEVANPRDPESNSDIIARFGIDHYYEVAIFTDDSADNPLIICVRELPPGFPQGGAINEAVQVAGFFFKTWAFYTTEGVQAETQNPPVPRRQLAPLLIARSVVWVRDDVTPPDSGVAMTLAAVFLGLIVVATISVWRFNKRDEQFRKEVIVRKYDTEPGTSLDDAGLVTVDGPDFSNLQDEGAGESSASTANDSSSPVDEPLP